MAKDTIASRATALSSARAKLHAACKTGDAKKIGSALAAADEALDGYKERVEEAKARLDNAAAVI